VKPSKQAMGAALRAIKQDMDEGEATEKHSILVRDPRTDTCQIIGPFRDRLTAKIEVEFLRARNLAADPEFADLIYEVVLTFSPEES
jgi:hypothetical protein